MRVNGLDFVLFSAHCDVDLALGMVAHETTHSGCGLSPRASALVLRPRERAENLQRDRERKRVWRNERG